jgi:hypothetical protein
MLRRASRGATARACCRATISALSEHSNGSPPPLCLRWLKGCHTYRSIHWTQSRASKDRANPCGQVGPLRHAPPPLAALHSRSNVIHLCHPLFGFVNRLDFVRSNAGAGSKGSCPKVGSIPAICSWHHVHLVVFVKPARTVLQSLNINERKLQSAKSFLGLQ